MGGCTALNFIVQQYSSSFIEQNAEVFLHAYLEVISGLSDEISSGAVDMATDGIGLLVNICLKAEDEQTKNKLIELITNRAISLIGDAIPSLREQCFNLLEKITEISKISISQLFNDRYELISNRIKEGLTYFASMSNSARIGFIVSFSHWQIVPILAGAAHTLYILNR